MKKIISFILCVCFIFVFSACGENNSNNIGTTIEHYAALGRMPEANFALGADIEASKAELLTIAENDSEKFYNALEGSTTGYFTDGDFEYYYAVNNTDAGIGYIVSYTDAFGFKAGTVITEIEAALKGSEYEKTATEPEDVFFLMGTGNGTVIKCEYEKSTVAFIFLDNVLCATTLYHNDWK